MNLQTARSVIGVELCGDAIEDANTNAHNNGKLLTIGGIHQQLRGTFNKFCSSVY